jgi:hypothetical protein
MNLLGIVIAAMSWGGCGEVMWRGLRFSVWLPMLRVNLSIPFLRIKNSKKISWTARILNRGTICCFETSVSNRRPGRLEAWNLADCMPLVCWVGIFMLCHVHVVWWWDLKGCCQLRHSGLARDLVCVNKLIIKCKFCLHYVFWMWPFSRLYFIYSYIIYRGEEKLRIETSGGEQHRRPRLT